MFRRISVVVTTILLPFFSVGQKVDEKQFPALFIRTNPLSFIEQHAGPSLGLGFQLNKRWAATVDGQLLLYELYQEFHEWDYRFSYIDGWKLRADVRYNIVTARRPRGVFIAPEFHLKNMKSRQEGDFGINCVGGMCDYYMRAEYVESRHEIGGAIKFGHYGNLVKERLFLEGYFGLGMKYNSFKYKGLPPGGSFEFPPGMGFLRASQGKEDHWAPNFPVGVKLFYRIVPGKDR